MATPRLSGSVGRGEGPQTRLERGQSAGVFAAALCVTPKLVLVLVRLRVALRELLPLLSLILVALLEALPLLDLELVLVPLRVALARRLPHYWQSPRRDYRA